MKFKTFTILFNTVSLLLIFTGCSVMTTPDVENAGVISGTFFGIDEETLKVRAVEVTTNNVGDAPMLPELFDQIPEDQNIGPVAADGAYDTRKCYDAIAARGAYAVIPPRRNAKPWKLTSLGAIARNEAVNASRYLG